jgi:hypothetical protein
MLQFGNGFTYTPRPDRTRLNGRRIPLLLSEPVQRALRITTVPRRQPPFFVERSLYDNSLMQVTLMVQLQIASLVSLTPGTLPKTNRDMLVAELVQEFEDLVVGDREVAKLRIDIRVTAIRGDLFDYVFATTNFRVGEGRDTMAERMDEDVLALFDSFSIASVVDPKAAERAELLRADQGFETFLSTHGAKMFGGQLGIAAGRLRETEYDTPEGIARAMSTLRPFRIFAGMLLHDPDIDMPDLWAAMAAAEQGDSAPLRNFLDVNLKTSTASAQAAAPAPQTHPALMPPTDLVQDGAAAEP